MNQEKFNTLKLKVAYGLFVLMIRDFGLKVISLLGQIILIRLVLPEHFGIFAIIVFVIGIYELFADLGLNQSIVREKKKLSTLQINTMVYTKIMSSSGIMDILILSYPLISQIYRQLTSDNFLMLIVLSSTLLAKSIKGVSVALIDKDLNFGLVAKVDFIGLLIYFCVAIFLAINNLMIWNFILALFIKEYVELFLVLHYKPLPLRFKFSFKSIRHLVKYGYFLQLGNFVNFIDSSVIPIAGFRLSAVDLGLLNWSFNITSLSNSLFDNYGRAAFAGMSKIQSMKDKLSLFVNKSINLLNIVSYLIVGLVIGYSKEFTVLFLTSKWLPALPSLYWFISSLLFYGGAVTLAHALLAIGKSKEVALTSAFIVAFEIIFAFCIQSYVGFTGIAIAVFLVYFLLFISYMFLARRFELSIDIRKILFEKLYLLIALIIVIFTFNYFTPANSVLFFFLKILGTIIIYIVSLIITSKEDLKEVFRTIKILKSKR